MKKILLTAAAVLLFAGCSKFDGLVGVAGAINNYNPDKKSREALKAYGSVRKEVRSAQELKKQDADTSRACGRL